VIYRDCKSAAGFANPITVGLYKATNYSSIGTRQVYMTGKPVDITPCNSSGNCIEQATYIDTVSLSANQTYGQIFTCGASQRNNAIINLDLGVTQSNDKKSMGWQINIPSPNTYINSSPKLGNRLQNILATNKKMILANNIFDADGDSLVYSFVTPYGSTSGTPGSGYAMQPPLSSILCDWASGYSATKPFGSNGSISIDSVTGKITLYAPSSNKYVVTIQIDEYRTTPNQSPVFMGETRRDYNLLHKLYPTIILLFLQIMVAPLPKLCTQEKTIALIFQGLIL